ncbi:MAG: glutamate dehydrogenase [Actinomycetota bacterium]|nr:glutamate dehydrogenase [Actinomycetota bacterium]
MPDWEPAPSQLPDDSPLESLEEALAPIVALVSPPGERGRLVEAFARAVLRRVPPRELEDADPVSTAVALVDAFDFVDGRAPGDIRVRLLDPRVTVDGWHSTGTVVQVSCEDRQFIVTTVKEELHRLGHKVTRILHPVFGSERAADGRLVAILAARDAEHRESFLQAELAARVAPEARRALLAGLQDVLGDVFSATGDFLAMREQVARASSRLRAHAALRFPADEVAEGADLLEWLLDDNFVLEGCCRLAGGDVVDAYGILAEPDAPLRFEPDPPAPDDAGPDDAGPVRIVRTGEVSTVHRQVPMHRIDVVDVGPEGEVAGTFRLVGVFSRKAAAQPAVVTPVLRFKLRRILELEDVVEGGHDEAMLVSLFQVLPKEELFEADVATLRQVVVGLAAAEQRNDVQVLLHVEPVEHTVSALLSVPQELYSTGLRRRIERFLLAQLDGARVDANVSLGEGADVIVRLVVQVDGPLPEPPLHDIEREVRLLCRTWDEELTEALIGRVGDGRGTRLAQAWADWFPPAYRGAVAAADAVDDVLQLDALGPGRPDDGGPDIAVVLTPGRGDRGDARLKVFSRGRAVELSRFLPIVESLGLWAVEEVPYVLGAGEGDAGIRAHLHDFAVTDPSGRPLDVEGDGPRLAQAALAMWDGRAEVDSLNRLVLRAGVAWDDVAVLRAYRRYRSQVGTTFTTRYVDDVLVANAAIARCLLELFAARFDPVRAAGTSIANELRNRIVDGCDAVPRLDHDRILRGFLALVDATLRTNRYLPNRPATGAAHLALKFDSEAVPDVPRPVPYREIFVYGPAVEGVHLRWGPVARGGIRWSERPDDYRSEVLGLMRAQVLKNALIVPTGAKGGFVVRQPGGGRGRSEVDVTGGDVRAAYEIFVTGLLELTDNVVGEEVVGVPRRRDGDDPYLVVAADRGTAGFSDLANQLSDDRRFWLGDAFASGGSRGYDHKQLGITARGVWVAVRHHLADLGIDLERETGAGDGDAEDATLSVAGIGDMSGDVFGNGMLQSDRIRLLAAFDHRDIFLDPDPDPAASFRERSRLFAVARSSWQDYDRNVVSPGGGVWSRLDKRIPVSAQVRTVLRIDAAITHLSPPELIRAILRAPVDLLFAGGIGTFVRAGDEPDRQIDDRANAEVRVTASQVRARVVGEGANLAFTQRARIEYARRGGHVNTDAIDNSAGVDISDHEVNLKILLRPAVESGEITVQERDRLLTDVCDDVVAAVLHDSARQSMALGRAQAASPARVGAIERLMVELEAANVVDRAVEALPTTEEMGARARAGAGLTRPELAVLLAGAKRSLTAHLLASAVPEQPALRAALASYFPDRLARRFDHLLDRHRLRRELVASMVANEVVDRMGVTFTSRLSADSGRPPAEVAAAWWVARLVVDAASWWPELDGDDGRPRPPVHEQTTIVRTVLEALTRDYLRRGDGADIAAGVARDRPAAVALASGLPGIGTVLRRRRRARLAEALVDGGLEPEAAARWAHIGDLEMVADVAEVARPGDRPVLGVARALVDVEEALGIDQLVERVRNAVVDADDGWSQVAVRGLLDDLDDLRRQGAQRALASAPDLGEAEAVARFLAARARGSAEVWALLRRIDAEPKVRLDALAVATRTVRRAIDA